MAETVALSLALGQWDLIIDALQQVADDVESAQAESDLAVWLRNEIDLRFPGRYGGCMDIRVVKR